MFAIKKRARLQDYERFLKRFKYKDALSAALNVSNEWTGTGCNCPPLLLPPPPPLLLIPSPSPPFLLPLFLHVLFLPSSSFTSYSTLAPTPSHPIPPPPHTPSPHPNPPLYQSRKTKQRSVVIYSLLQELARRDGLSIAISGRNEKELLPLLGYLINNVIHPKYSDLLLDICLIVVG